MERDPSQRPEGYRSSVVLLTMVPEIVTRYTELLRRLAIHVPRAARTPVFRAAAIP